MRSEVASDPKSKSSSGESCATIEDRYVLSREIGRGSTGVVWEARDLTNGELVAVKILHSALLASPAARARFRREVASASALDHPNSVRIKAHGQTAAGDEYLVMECLVGRTLGALLGEAGPLSQPRAIRIFAQILDAIASAHHLNIVHRDLKPSNVILVESGGEPEVVKVCDFGLAKVFRPEVTDEDEDDADATRSLISLATDQGDLCGTPQYMSPEQARGENLDGRADLYSVAVMLFQAVVGQLPFRGKSPFMVISQHLGALPPRPSDVRPDLGLAPALEKLILRGMAKDRSERPSSAEVFRADLLQVERDLQRDERRRARRGGSAAEGATWPSTMPGLGRGGPRLAVLASAVALLGAAVAFGGLGWRPWGRPSPSVGLPSAEVGTPAPFVLPAPATAIPAAAPDPAAAASAQGSASAGGAPSALALASRSRGAEEKRSGRTLGAGAEPRRTARARASDVVEDAEAKAPTPDLAGASAVGPSPSAAVGPAPARPIRPAPVADSSLAEAEAIILRAEDLLAEGRGGEACAQGESAASRDPGLAAAQEFLGRCYMRIGQPDKARNRYRRYLELAPGAGNARFIRAIVDPKR